MQVAITGHSEGIGKAFATLFQKDGYEVIGLSRRTGRNIRSIARCVGDIVPCDIFINNAQAGFAQTELLYKVWDQWKDTNKTIWNIGSIMSTHSVVPYEMEEYKLQKQTLDLAVQNLNNQNTKCNISMIRPGAVATQPHNNAGVDSADVMLWASTVYDLWKTTKQRGLLMQEINLGYGS